MYVEHYNTDIFAKTVNFRYFFTNIFLNIKLNIRELCVVKGDNISAVIKLYYSSITNNKYKDLN